MRAAMFGCLLAAPVLVVAAPLAAETRDDLAPLERALTQAADRVARPNVLGLTGADCRGYRIDGVGAVFVLPPRAVRSHGVVVWRRVPGGPPARGRDREIRVIEQQALELQREAARTHAEVERAMAEVQREVERRRAAAGRVASTQPAPPTAPPSPVAPEAPLAPLPPSPPWSLWLDPGNTDDLEAPAEAVVERMRVALVEALAEHGTALRGLRADETIAAAVDFVPSFPFGPSRPEKTLVLRVRKKDLEERRTGRIGPDQLRARIETAEY
jgi:hypothetical protein